MDLSNLLTKSLTAYDKSRDRSIQVEIGPSQIGGCRRQVYHQLKGTPVTNDDTEALAAILGTFIHSGIAEAIKRADPFGDNFLIEEEFTVGDLKGHVDLYIKDQKTIVDWKTTKLKSLRFFPSRQQRLQVQIYGYLLTANGYEVENVALVAVPRDGEMGEIKTHSERYDPKMAQEGLAWLAEVKEMAVSNNPAPAPEKDPAFCVRYCDYFDATGEIGCHGIAR